MSATPAKALLATVVLSRVCFPTSYVGQIPLQAGAAAWATIWFSLLVSVASSFSLGRCCSSCCFQLLWAAPKAGDQRGSLELLVSAGWWDQVWLESAAKACKRRSTRQCPDVIKAKAVTGQLAKEQPLNSCCPCDAATHVCPCSSISTWSSRDPLTGARLSVLRRTDGSTYSL